MSRTASRRKRRQSVSQRMLRSAGILVAQNPVLVGGATAFLLTLSFVSANALWYQPYGHPAALFPTRPLVFKKQASPDTGLPESISGELETTIRIEREDVASIPADPTVQRVQEVLSELDLYTGSVDGIAGPKTRDAIRSYRRIIGLEPSDAIDDDLLDQLGTKPEVTAAITPVPVARPDETEMTDGTPAARGSLVVRIQGGLRAFGNDHIEIDGIIGEQTRQAIREFQTLFGLEANGNADETVLAKMRELGLAD
ncbi:MAG: peptidoglycan-binding protein [Rhizobiaceae bacterium]